MAVSLLEYIEENYDNLLSIAYSYTGNTADAQDIVQQVALEVCKRKNELNSIEFPRAYLSISIRNRKYIAIVMLVPPPSPSSSIHP